MPKGNRQLFEHLILAVQTKEELYNPYCRGYKDRNTCDNAWRYVAQATGLSPAEAKRTWSTLRSSYSRSLHNEQLSRGHNLPARTRWYLTSHMDFLRPFLQGYHKDNMKMEDGDDDDDGEDDHHFALETLNAAQVPGLEGYPSGVNGLDGNPSVSSPNTSSTTNIDSPLPTGASLEPITPLPPKRPKLDMSQCSPGLPPYPEVSNSFSMPGSWYEDDADILFFRSLLPSMRELSKKRQRKLKLQISKLVYDELAEQEEEEKNEQKKNQNNMSTSSENQQQSPISC